MLLNQIVYSASVLNPEPLTSQVTIYLHFIELNSQKWENLPADFVSFSLVQFLIPSLPCGPHTALAVFFFLLSFSFFPHLFLTF